MSISSKHLVHQASALVLSIYYSYEAPNCIWYIWCNLSNTLRILPVKNIENKLQKNASVLLILNYLVHESGFGAGRTTQFKIYAFHKIPSSPTKNDLMRFIRSMNFFSNFKDKLQNKLKALYGLLLENLEFHWKFRTETLFQQTKTSITKDVTLTLPNENYPFFEADSFWIGKGCILYRKNNKGKLDFFFEMFAVLYN